MGMKVKPDCFCLKSSVLNARGAQLSYTVCFLFVYLSFLSVGDFVSSGGRTIVRNRPLEGVPATIMTMRNHLNCS